MLFIATYIPIVIWVFLQVSVAVLLDNFIQVSGERRPRLRRPAPGAPARPPPAPPSVLRGPIRPDARPPRRAPLRPAPRAAAPAAPT